MARGKTYPQELKDRAIAAVLDGGRPIRQVAKDLDIGPESLRGWVRRAEADAGTRKDVASSAELDEVRLLRRENRELKRANEILKAASVFFAVELDGTLRR